MTLSLNEVEATAKKATIGAGYPWGLAEEASKAVRWLCRHDIDGCSALAALLQQVDSTPLSDWMPEAQEPWTAAGGTLCPLATGAAISDRAHMVAEGVRIGRITQPVLLVPFAASLAQQVEQTVTIAWERAEAITDGARVSLKGPVGDAADGAIVRLGGDIEAPRETSDRVDPKVEDWDTLLAFAHRTYAPATEESRLKGAGAGVTDND